MKPTIQKTSSQLNISDGFDSLPEIVGEPSVVLSLIDKFCRMLAEEDINYCLWKGSYALDRSANGDSDIDLLVSRPDADRFRTLLSRLGFKQAEAPPEMRLPGVQDYYGYDYESDKFVHVHVYYQLVLGHNLTNNYRIPIERPYLASATLGELFKVPEPEFELIVFVIRMVLKHMTWDAMLIGGGRLSSVELRKLANLQTRADHDRMDEILKQHLSYVSVNLFDRCLQALQSDSSLWTKHRIGQELKSSLKAFVLRSQPQDIWLKLWRKVTWGFRRRLISNKLNARRLANGGAIIALVGGDGAGKSTVVDGLQKWLSKDFEVYYTHLGKPGRSKTTKFLRGLFKVGRTLTSTPYVSDSTVLYKADTEVSGWVIYNLAVNAVCAARDRNLAYSRARRLANKGGLVISDRFPLSQINLTDGPIIERLLNDGPDNALIQLLVKLEKKYYRPIAWPELLIVLKLDPQIAVQRKTDEDPEYVQARSQLIWAFDWLQTPASVVDAARGQEEVLSEVKYLIWSEL